MRLTARRIEVLAAIAFDCDGLISVGTRWSSYHQGIVPQVLYGQTDVTGIVNVLNRRGNSFVRWQRHNGGIPIITDKGIELLLSLPNERKVTK